MKRALSLLVVAVAVAVAVTFVGSGIASCTRAEPPSPELGDASPSAIPLPPASLANGGAQGTARPAAPLPDASPGVPSDASPPPAPDDPASLPQTHDRPAASGPVLDARVAALWDAIVHDEPERAAPFFFPVRAYAQVKAIPRPESDWKHRLFAAYARDIHALHKKLGEAPESAKLVRLEIPAGGGRWVEPDEETNKIGYFRVYGSRLHYEAGGARRSFEVKSLISWRGEWYVVHLSGFK